MSESETHTEHEGKEDSYGEGEEEGEEDLSVGTEKRAKPTITGRGMTLVMLMKDNVIQPGDGVLSLEYLGQTFTGDLLVSGNIQSVETGQVFSSPSSWAIFCKQLVNPDKKSGSGWGSVKYKGKKLDAWKTTWLRQKQTQSPYTAQSSSPASVVSENNSEVEETGTTNTTQTTDNRPGSVNNNSGVSIDNSDNKVGTENKDEDSRAMLGEGDTPKEQKEEPMDVEQGVPDSEPPAVLDLTTKPAQPSKVTISPKKDKSAETDVCYIEEQEEALNLSLKKTPPSVKKKPEIKQEPPDTGASSDRKPIRHGALPDRSQNIDPNTLVECERFSNLGKIQPFTVSMSTNSQLLLDFHCHLTTSEVVGYLGGKWDHNTQHLSIQQAFPCRCRLGDTQNAPVVEDEIRQTMKHLGMSLVGWYHSHPYCLPEPSVKDVDCQIAYQLRMKGSKSTYFPCVGIINSPYYGKSKKMESSIQMYMVMPPPENVKSDYGIPMHLKYSVKQNQSVSEELLSEMKKLADFYRGSPDWIKFQHSWHPGVTYMEKLKISLKDKLPEDQMENGTFLDFVTHILIPKG